MFTFAANHDADRRRGRDLRRTRGWFAGVACATVVGACAITAGVAPVAGAGADWMRAKTTHRTEPPAVTFQAGDTSGTNGTVRAGANAYAPTHQPGGG